MGYSVQEQYLQNSLSKNIQLQLALHWKKVIILVPDDIQLRERQSFNNWQIIHLLIYQTQCDFIVDCSSNVVLNTE